MLLAKSIIGRSLLERVEIWTKVYEAIALQETPKYFT
jgi:hypothetical protein